MKKTLFTTIVVFTISIFLTGCDDVDRNLLLQNFKNGKELMCNKGVHILLESLVVSTTTYQYSENLEVFYNKDGKYIRVDDCNYEW